MASVALQHGDDQKRQPCLLDLDAADSGSRAARIAGFTLITIVVVGIMALWTHPVAHADHLRPNDSSLTILALPALRPLAFGSRSPFDPEAGPTASAPAPIPAGAIAAPDIPPATGDTDTTQNQAASISESFSLLIAQDPIA